jgi:hypothetical protein
MVIPPALADGPHLPTPPVACTAVSTGSTVRCSFVASVRYGQQAIVLGAPSWSVTVLRHGRIVRLQVSQDACFGYQIRRGAYYCGLPLRAGDHVTITVRSAGVVRAGDDICAEDPICMGPAN